MLAASVCALPQHGQRDRWRAMTSARRKRKVAIDPGRWRYMGPSPARAEAFGYGRYWESSTVFFTAAQALQGQKAIGSDAQAGVMMKAAPVASFVVTQSQFPFEFQVVPLDTPAALDGADECLEGRCLRQCRQPVARRLRIAAGPLDDQPFVVSGVIVVGGDHAHAGATPRRRRRGGGRLMHTPPHRGERPDAQRVDQVLRAQLVAKRTVIAVGGFAQHHAPRHLGGDPVLGQEAHRGGHASLGAPLRIVGPLGWRVELISQGQAVRVRRQRQAYRHPSVVGLAGLPIILAGYAHRVRALLRKTGIIDDPVTRLGPAARQDWQHLLGDRGQQSGVTPWRGRHQVVHGLMG